jgi:hypothetical protein
MGFRCQAPHFSQKKPLSYFRMYCRIGVCARSHPRFSHLLQRIPSQRLHKIPARLYETPLFIEYPRWLKFQTNRLRFGKVVSKWICTWCCTRHITLNSCVQTMRVSALYSAVHKSTYCNSWPYCRPHTVHHGKNTSKTCDRSKLTLELLGCSIFF